VFVTTRKKDGRGTVHDCRVVLTEREGLGESRSARATTTACAPTFQVVATP